MKSVRVLSQSYAEARRKFIDAAVAAGLGTKAMRIRCSDATANCWPWTWRAVGR